MKTVGDYVSLQRGTTYRGDLVGEPGPALLGLGSIVPGGGFRADHWKTFGGECPAKLTLGPGDLFVALKGNTTDGSMIGSVARVPPDLLAGRLTQDTAKLEFLESDSGFARYLYWLLRTPQYRAYCAGCATGTTAVGLSRDDFLAYPIPLMTEDSHHLVELFEAIETQIELNRRMNRILESMARALFKSWFVDFDPVRKKVAGGNDKLPPDLAALFPNSFDGSGPGAGPHGWERGTLADVAALNPELRAKSTLERSINYVDLSSTKWGRIEAVTTYPAHDAPSRAQRVLRPGDTIVGTVRPGNGSYALVAQEDLIGSTGFAVLRPAAKTYAPYVYLAATASENIEALSRLADGGAYPAVRPDAVTATAIVRPNHEVLSAFSRVVGPLLEKSARNERQSRTVANLRDSLLPRLISGEAPVSGASAPNQGVDA